MGVYVYLYIWRTVHKCPVAGEKKLLSRGSNWDGAAHLNRREPGLSRARPGLRACDRPSCSWSEFYQPRQDLAHALNVPDLGPCPSVVVCARA